MIHLSTGKRLAAALCVLSVVGVSTVVLSGAGMAASQSEMPAEEKALAKLDADWSAAAATRDAKRVASFYAEDAVVCPPNEPAVVGRAAAEKAWAGFLADPTYNLSWKTTHADAAGTLGYTAGTYEESFTGPDGKKVAGKGKYLCVWRKETDGTWKAIHDMWNSDTK